MLDSLVRVSRRGRWNHFTTIDVHSDPQIHARNTTCAEKAQATSEPTCYLTNASLQMIRSDWKHKQAQVIRIGAEPTPSPMQYSQPNRNCTDSIQFPFSKFRHF